MNEKQTLTPQDIAALKREIISSLHCALPGIVKSFDADSQTAVIQPGLSALSSRPEQSGAEGSLAYPLLRDVPVFMPWRFDIFPGDPCLVIFADCDIDAWFDGGEQEQPLSGRKHSLSDAFAFVGFKRRSDA